MYEHILATVAVLSAIAGNLLLVSNIMRRNREKMSSTVDVHFNAIEKRFERMTESFSANFGVIDTRFNSMAMQINTMMVGDIRELRDRVGRLESGQDEWTKTLRARTHELAECLNKLLLKVDRVERSTSLNPKPARSEGPCE